MVKSLCRKTAIAFLVLVSISYGQMDSAVSIRLLNGRDSLGSGVLVLNGQYALTAYHVVNNRVPFEVTHSKSGRVIRNAKVLAYSEARDLTLLDLRGVVGPALKLSPEGIKVGETVSILGCSRGSHPHIVKGVVQTIKPLVGVDGKSLKVVGEVCQGDSGGVFLNGKGEIVGAVQIGYRPEGRISFTHRGHQRSCLRYVKGGGCDKNTIATFLNYVVKKLNIK